MPHPRRRTCNPPLQLELGFIEAPMAPAGLPSWTALPEATQQRLTELLTRLLVSHGGDAGAAPARSSADER